MPTPDRTSLDEIIQAGRDILESAGFAGLTMQAVADRVGVRPPSLYKRVRGRDDLVRLIADATIRDLGERLEQTGPRSDLAELTRTLRAFAHAYPVAYPLIYATRKDAAGPSFEVMNRAVAPVLRAARELAGEEHALEAARTITAWAHGFLSMELAGAFQLGGDVDRAFDFGVEHLVRALSGTGRSAEQDLPQSPRQIAGQPLR